MKQRLLILAAALLLSGCASIVGSSTQAVRIDSLPQGARFTVQDEDGRSVAEGYTPQTVELAKSTGRYFGKKHYQVMLESPGYVPVTLPIEGKANLWHPRPFLNPVGARG